MVMSIFVLMFVWCSVGYCGQPDWQTRASLLSYMMDGPSFRQTSTSAVSYVAKGDAIEIKVHLSGYGPEDVSVAIEDGVLTVTHITKKDACNTKDKKEKEADPSGKLLAEVALPNGLDIAKVDAVMKNGLLTITITRAKQKAWSIKVRGA